jgi:hypothetical protein
MRPVTLNTSNASGGTVNSNVAVMDYNCSLPFNVGILCVVTGTATYSIQHSDDNTNWFQNANINGATTSLDTNYMFPVKYIRLQQTGGSGSVAATIIQAGPGR